MTDARWELGQLPSSSLPTLPVQGQSLSWDALDVGAQTQNSLADDGAELLGANWEPQRCDLRAAKTGMCSPSPGSTSSGKKKRGPRPRLFKKYECMVDGCVSDLSTSSFYYQRNHICSEHLKLPSIQVRGVPSRFCQRCGISHDISSFDGRKKSCRASLEKHKKRRLSKQSADGAAEDSSLCESHPSTPAAALVPSSPVCFEQPELGSHVPAATLEAGAPGSLLPAVPLEAERPELLTGSTAGLALGSRCSSSIDDLPGLSIADIAPGAAVAAAGQPLLPEPQDALCSALLGDLELPSLEDLEGLDWELLGSPTAAGERAGTQAAGGGKPGSAEGSCLPQPLLFAGLELPAVAAAAASGGSEQTAVGAEPSGGPSQPASQPVTPKPAAGSLAAQGSLPVPGGSVLSSPDSQVVWGAWEVSPPPVQMATAAAATTAANLQARPLLAGRGVRASEPAELAPTQWCPSAQQQHQHQQGCLHPTAVATAAPPAAPWSQAVEVPPLGGQGQAPPLEQPQNGQYAVAQQLSPLQVSVVQGTDSSGQLVLGTAWVLVPQSLMVNV